MHYKVLCSDFENHGDALINGSASVPYGTASYAERLMSARSPIERCCLSRVKPMARIFVYCLVIIRADAGQLADLSNIK